MGHKSDEPAFPLTSAADHQYLGMSLRDYFAAKAMQGFLPGPMNRMQFELVADVANLAYIMADAMLAERAK